MGHVLSYNGLIDSFVAKEERYRLQLTTPPLNYNQHTQQLVSCAQLLCERMGYTEPLGVAEAVYNLCHVSKVVMERDSLSLWM